MRPSIRVLFLLIIGCVVLNVGHLMAFITIFGYLAADGLDIWLARRVRRARQKTIDDVISGWKACKDDPDSEEKDGFQRRRLTGQNQIIAARVADLLRGMQ